MDLYYKNIFNQIIDKFKNKHIYKKYIFINKNSPIYKSSFETQFHYYCIKNNNIIDKQLYFLGYTDFIKNKPKSW